MSGASEQYVIGVDYGTLSGRALLVRVADGAEIATSVFEYPHAVIEDILPTSGAKLPPDWALQVPADYIEVLKRFQLRLFPFCSRVTTPRDARSSSKFKKLIFTFPKSSNSNR